jgi:hypothetical protein
MTSTTIPLPRVNFLLLCMFLSFLVDIVLTTLVDSYFSGGGGGDIPVSEFSLISYNM